MSNPYSKHLAELKEEGTPVTINRNGAPDVTGTIQSVDGNGCTIATPEKFDEVRRTFISHRDIRGVSSTGWNMDAIEN